MCLYIYKPFCTRLHVYIYKRMYIYIHVYICVYTVYIHIYLCIYTYKGGACIYYRPCLEVHTHPNTMHENVVIKRFCFAAVGLPPSKFLQYCVRIGAYAPQSQDEPRISIKSYEIPMPPCTSAPPPIGIASYYQSHNGCEQFNNICLSHAPPHIGSYRRELPSCTPSYPGPYDTFVFRSCFSYLLCVRGSFIYLFVY